MHFGPIILLRVGPALGGPQGLVISIVIVYKVKHSEEIQISWLREPLEFPEDRLYTPHTAGSCSRATGIPGGGRSTMVRGIPNPRVWTL